MRYKWFNYLIPLALYNTGRCLVFIKLKILLLTLFWRGSLSYRNQSIDLLYRSIDGFCMIAWRYYISIIYISYDRSILYLQDERDLFMKVLNLEKRFASNWLELLTAYPCRKCFSQSFLRWSCWMLSWFIHMHRKGQVLRLSVI